MTVSYQGRLVCLQINIKQLFLSKAVKETITKGCFVCNLHEMTVFYHGMLFCMHIYMNRHEKAVSYKSWQFSLKIDMQWLTWQAKQPFHVICKPKQPGFVGNSPFMYNCKKTAYHSKKQPFHVYLQTYQPALVRNSLFMSISLYGEFKPKMAAKLTTHTSMRPNVYLQTYQPALVRNSNSMSKCKQNSVPC